jgi:hypothetical protein
MARYFFGISFLMFRNLAVRDHGSYNQRTEVTCMLMGSNKVRDLSNLRSIYATKLNAG